MAGVREVDAHEPVFRLLTAVFAAQTRDIVGSWSAAHLNTPEGVHDMRVAARRLRSLLATGRPFLDEPFAESIRDELGWLIGALGGARDAEVQAARIGEALARLVAERGDLDWDAEHVRPALLAPLQARHESALVTLRDGLESARYGELAERLGDLAVTTPWTDAASATVASAYPQRVRRELRRVDARMAAAVEADLDPETRTTRLHDARRTVKRARYALAPVVHLHGTRARRLAERLKTLQQTLGDLQDTVITRHYLHDLVVSEGSTLDPHVALAAGALIEREAAHAVEYDETALAAWERVRRAKPIR